MSANKRRPPPIRRISTEQALAECLRDIVTYERIYECPSSGMWDALRDGKARDTAEVAIWMMRYAHLQELKARAHEA